LSKISSGTAGYPPLASRLSDFRALIIPLVYDLAFSTWSKTEGAGWVISRQKRIVTTGLSKRMSYLISFSVFLFLIPQIYTAPSKIFIENPVSMTSRMPLAVDSFVQFLTPAGHIMRNWYRTSFDEATSIAPLRMQPFKTFLL
jgi:hypothetical protein